MTADDIAGRESGVGDVVFPAFWFAFGVDAGLAGTGWTGVVTAGCLPGNVFVGTAVGVFGDSLGVATGAGKYGSLRALRSPGGTCGAGVDCAGANLEGVCWKLVGGGAGAGKGICFAPRFGDKTAGALISC